MRIRRFAFGLLTLLATLCSALGDQSDEIARLVQKLGDRSFIEREAASSRLEAIGHPALPALRHAASTSKDPEICRRAGQLLRVCGKLQAVEGTYYLGGRPLGRTLEIRGDGHFYAMQNGIGAEKLQGTVSQVDGWLVLVPKALPVSRLAPGMPMSYLPVRWGARTYLLAKDELLEFCSSVNQKVEPRQTLDGLFFLRHGDWMDNVQGPPALPCEWASYLLPKALQAEVIAMANARTGKLNIGHAQGIRPGMVLQNGQNNRFPCLVRVVSVDKDTCLIRELNELIVPDIKIGDRVGSQPIAKPDTGDLGVMRLP